MMAGLGMLGLTGRIRNRPPGPGRAIQLLTPGGQGQTHLEKQKSYLSKSFILCFCFGTDPLKLLLSFLYCFISASNIAFIAVRTTVGQRA